ncbi:MAG TPA: threonine ammonia-lyase [Micropepsaceae bacterium]|jgi:threonine dehydratase|nr:threonine ammonia-lyase [Micropepsaceae bacterium]
MDTSFPVTPADIERAARAIAGAVEYTPARFSRTLSAIAGTEIFLKFENLQFTASFKERGALNRLLALDAEQRRRGVIAMSAGNHAQGVAYHAGRLGIPATIVMPEGTPFTKVKHTRDFGAHIVIEGASLSESYVRAKAMADAQGYTLIHPYDDPLVIAGQGTTALEFLTQIPQLDTLVVPIGGGGLISGMAIAARSMKPDIRIYGVEAKLYPAMHNALTGENLDCAGLTIAEGIAVKDPGAIAKPIIRALVSDILLAGEAELEAAIVKLLEIEKTLAEGAGAAALAAVLANPALFAGHKVGIVISGGNIDMRLLSNIILRELAREGRIQSLVIPIEDRPGLLARIASIIGEAGGNIMEVSHNRLMTGVSAKSADLGLVVEARDATHAAEIKARLKEAGFTVRG